MPQPQQVFAARTVAGFPDVLKDEAYTPVPQDSWIAVTDVVGSTEAISQGRYKDVNLAGAAGIAAFANAFPGLELPTFFGGDGAAILIPSGAQDKAAQLLSGLQNAAGSALGLKLRTALTPVALVRDQGFDVRILYQEIENGRRLAMLCGGGVAAAEAHAKRPVETPLRVPAQIAEIAPNFEGLSCRWQAVRPQRGLMLTVLVQGPPEPSAYFPVFDVIAAAAAGPQSPLARPANPIWPPRGLMAEARLRNPKNRIRYALGALGQSALGAISTVTGIKVGGFDGPRYRDSLARHCDALKFADGLKMVVDCTLDEAMAVEAALTNLPRESGFAFGLHRSSSALMTCFVQTTADGGHVHFIDGAEGGYAVAAQQMKRQKGANLP